MKIFDYSVVLARAPVVLHVPTRSDIEALERHLIEMPQVDIPVTHRFAKGMYSREIVIPADTLMTGKVHLHEHVSIMVSGDMTVLTDAGMQRISGYHVFISPPGTKRVGYAHAETVWLTVHLNPTEERDPDRIEALLVEPWEHAPALAARKELLCPS